MNTFFLLISGNCRKCITAIGIYLLLFCSQGYSQQLSMKMAKLFSAPAVTPTPPPSITLPGGPPAALLAAVAAPTIAGFSPTAAGAGSIVHISGSNFDGNTQVSFGGIPAAAVSVISTGVLYATVSSGAIGKISVSNAFGANSSTGNFTFVPAPGITKVVKTKSAGSSTITISGTNFTGFANVSVNGSAFIPGIILSPASVQVTIPGNPVIYSISVNTPGGTVDNAAADAPQGNADLNLPDFGNGLTLVPTPSLDYSQVMQGRNWGFRERVWGNSLGIDSGRQKLGAKFLSVQTSIFGLSAEFNQVFTNQGSPVSLALAVELNFLLKKVSFFDTAAKTNTNFNPFVIHPRIGLVSTFFNNNVYAGLYANIPSVVGSNDAFALFFNAHSKNVFIYPEIALGGLIGLGNGGSQAIKIDLNLMVNNGEARFITSSTDKVIPFLKIGFLTAL